MEDLIHAILYGHLELEIKDLSDKEQLEALRAIVANPSCVKRLKIDSKMQIILECLRWLSPEIEHLQHTQPQTK